MPMHVKGYYVKSNLEDGQNSLCIWMEIGGFQVESNLLGCQYCSLCIWREICGVQAF